MPSDEVAAVCRNRVRLAVVLAVTSVGRVRAAATVGLTPTIFSGRDAQAAILRYLEGRLAAARAASYAA